MVTEASTNSLTNETSPYLLQHAHNPVEWHAWNAETLQKATDEDKPLLISVGYAACHWCHVMAHESFEDKEIARVMNDRFICIKVDREERPDVDAQYMRAVQAITGGGGWPLHAFALPDGRPFYGGTYFPKTQWLQLCVKVADEYAQNRERLISFAKKLSEGISETSSVISIPKDESFSRNIIDIPMLRLQPYFDPQNGGLRGAPKFPMPSLVNFFLTYGSLTQNESVLSHVNLTLQKMAMGGIYDHVGGGFARYSTDPTWKVPHFEKMLYDNAQLVSLYCKGFRQFKNPLFKDTVEGTVEFLLRELRTDDGLFASSLDADSEGVEGKYYVWSENELKTSLGILYPTAQRSFSIYPEAVWEKDVYILHKTTSQEEAASDLGLGLEEYRQQIKQIRTILFNIREERVRPSLDHKALISWNGLAIEGLANAYDTFHHTNYLKAAEDAADFILAHTRMKDSGLFHSYTNGEARIPGFLDDYSSMIRGLIALYLSTFNEKWIHAARELMDYTIDHFFDAESKLFFFTSDQQADFLNRDLELDDGVIPSSNSTSAHNLFLLGRFFEKTDWEDLSKQMLLNIKDALSQNLTSYSNWASLFLAHSFPFYDVAISGADAISFAHSLRKELRSNVLFAGSAVKSELAMMRDRFKKGETRIFVCKDKVCSAPKETVNEALKLIN
jgi:uncharacterized protein